MPIYKGSLKIDTLYAVGKIEQCYKGSQLVFQNKLPTGTVLFEKYGANAVGYSPGGFDTTLWTNFQIISNPTPVDGNWSAIYNSWNTPASKRTVSAYNGVEGGPGSSGYNDAAQNAASYPAIGGYVKVTIVE